MSAGSGVGRLRGTGWREALRLEVDRFPHPSWGPSHCRRVYELSLDLAAAEGFAVDDDILYGLAYLHDLGAFEPYASRGGTPQEAALLAANEILPRCGFPAAGRERLSALVLAHSWDSDPGPSSEGRLFRDADMLDFMGAIGITRLLAIVGIEEWLPTVADAVESIRAFSHDIPPRLLTYEARRIAERRRLESDTYLAGLVSQTSSLQAL